MNPRHSTICIRRIFLTVATAFLAAGCVVMNDHSSGTVALTQPLVKCVARFDPQLPQQFHLQKMSHYGTPKISSADQAHAIADARELDGLFARSLVSTFSESAKKYGITTVAVSAPGAYDVAIRVSTLSWSCSDSGCGARLGLATSVLDPEGHVVWTYESTVGKATVFSKVDRTLVDAFVGALLEAMQKDGLVKR